MTNRTTQLFALLPSLLILLVTAALTDKNLAGEQPISFELDVQPVLTRFGCNAGSCHGKQRGQNGFQLSLLGFDSTFDHDAITKQARGRRIFPAAPQLSLLLLKASAQLPHGGGKRFDTDSEAYRLLRTWIAQGAGRSVEGETRLVRVEVQPAEVALAPTQTQQMSVTVFYEDGTTRDVTQLANYLSNDQAIVGVDETGKLTAGPFPGETAIMVRYMNMITVCSAAIPQQQKVPAEFYAALPRNNFIDDLVLAKLQSVGIKPSAETDDARFMRRAFTDIIGRFPAADEARTFLNDSDPEKRKKLIDRLLERPEYVDHWANKWADLLRPNPYKVGIKAVLNYDNWIRQQFRDNVPYDEFVRRIILAKGSTWHNGAATFYRERREPEEITTMVTQLFLGIRLECARCHHHPFEKWSQDDFFQFAAYFARVGRKGTGLSPPISGGEEIIVVAKSGSVTHPITGKVMERKTLFGHSADIAKAESESTEVDLRDELAAWITSKQNDYFAQVEINRVWADLMGRGIVDPVDDLRATNPPSNGPLLAALAKDFQDHDFDLKHLIRTICNSRTYALSSIPNETNVGDRINYSRHYRHRLRAEVLLDAVADVTGMPNSFPAMPADSRGNQVWTNRVGSLFLDTFGRPNENQDPPCERTTESTVTQTLHLMNAPDLNQKVRNDEGRAAKLAASEKQPDELVEELYLSIFSRFPTADELQYARELFAQPEIKRREIIEDLMWAMLNSAEFVVQD